MRLIAAGAGDVHAAEPLHHRDDPIARRESRHVGADSVDTSAHLFFFNVPAPSDIYTLSLHDALPISDLGGVHGALLGVAPTLPLTVPVLILLGALIFRASLAPLQLGAAHGLAAPSPMSIGLVAEIGRAHV